MEKKWPFSFHSVIIRIMICGDPSKGSRCYGDSRKKYRGRDRIVRLEILLGTASVGSKGRKLGEGRKEKKKEKMVGDLLTKYGRQASQRGADKGDR